MRYTLLELTARGIVLCDHHLRRLGLDEAELGAFAAFARTATPGTWAVYADGGELRFSGRPGSRLRDSMPVRFAPSPVLAHRGALPKPCPPSPYDEVRVPGVATLLTSADGVEIFEACSAAVLAWDGGALVYPPRDRPRVGSTAEAAILDALPARESPIAAAGSMPLLLVNAVKGACAVEAGRAPFPIEVRQRIEDVIAGSTRYPGP